MSGSSSTSRKEQNRCNHHLVAMSAATNMSCCKCIYEPGKCFSFSRSQDKNGDAQHAVQSAMTQWPFTKASLYLPITARRHSSIMGTSLRIPNASLQESKSKLVIKTCLASAKRFGAAMPSTRNGSEHLSRDVARSWSLISIFFSISCITVAWNYA